MIGVARNHSVITDLPDLTRTDDVEAAMVPTETRDERRGSEGPRRTGHASQGLTSRRPRGIELRGFGAGRVRRFGTVHP